jgi:hypothetical protein
VLPGSPSEDGVSSRHSDLCRKLFDAHDLPRSSARDTLESLRSHDRRSIPLPFPSGLRQRLRQAEHGLNLVLEEIQFKRFIELEPLRQGNHALYVRKIERRHEDWNVLLGKNPSGAHLAQAGWTRVAPWRQDKSTSAFVFSSSALIESRKCRRDSA